MLQNIEVNPRYNDYERIRDSLGNYQGRWKDLATKFVNNQLATQNLSPIVGQSLSAGLASLDHLYGDSIQEFNIAFRQEKYHEGLSRANVKTNFIISFPVIAFPI